jgi:hypothetical protein
MNKEIIKQIHDDLVAFTDHINQAYVAPITKCQDFADEPKLFLYTILFKLNNGLSSCRLFLSTGEHWQRHLDGLFIILRTMLSDSLISQYVIRKDYKGDAHIIENIRPLYTEHFKFTLRDLRKYGKKFFKYTDKDIGAEEQKIRKKYSDYFEVDGSFKYKPEITTLGDKVEYLVDNIDEEEVKVLLIKAHNLYMHFSKYEHLGILSLPMIWRQFDEKNHVTIFRQVTEAIMIVGHSIELCLRMWKQFDSGIDPAVRLSIEKFQKHRSDLLDLELPDK